jgi:hypothetical protein
MNDSELATLQAVLRGRWPNRSDDKLPNRFFKELGAVKLACLWMLDHADEFPSIKRKTNS